MNFEYSKEDDVLMIELNQGKIDYAEQTGNLIVHFSPKRGVVLLEILDASQFLKKAFKIIPAKIKQQIFRPSFPAAVHKK